MKNLLFGMSILIVSCSAEEKPKVFVLTDINLVGGDPDDRQSLVHLLWYSDELDIVGIVPDYWTGKGFDACQIGLSAYRDDYETFEFEKKGLTPPDEIEGKILRSNDDAVAKLKTLATESKEPIYVLVWGGMVTLKNALLAYPEIAENIRILTIATGVKYGPKDEEAGKDCNVVNWNGGGRNDIYEDKRFNDLWWIESNWTYNGMFEGDGPRDMFQKLSTYGSMGNQIKEVTKGHDWAQYFRVGDTPTVTYLIDKNHDVNNPESSSWAGLFKKPFPKDRPNYYTDDNGNIEWNYADPCKTWGNMKEMYKYNKGTLVKERQDMYDQLQAKLDRLYNK